MIFKELREKMFFEKEEIIINKKVNVRGKEILLLSLVKSNDSNKLWTLHINDDKEEDVFQFEGFTTNRDEQINNINRNRESDFINIKELLIQNQKVIFQSSSATAIEYMDNDKIFMLQHFIEKGMITKDWDNININNIIISTYEQLEEESFPEVNGDEKIIITLKIDETFKNVLVQHPFTVTLRKCNENTKIYYFDEDSKEENFFYLNGIEKYDLWKDTLKNIEIAMKNIDESEREEVKNDCISSVEKQCPKDKELITISYENEDDIQLCFFTKEYLEKEPVYNEGSSSMILSCGGERGINGYGKRIESLKQIEKDFAGELELEIELFSKYIKIPEEIITLEL